MGEIRGASNTATSYNFMSSYFSPETITWRVHSDPSMVVGGLRALLEQALQPDAMAGVSAHSNFRDDTWGRLQRTGDYVGILTFSPKADADKLAARVRNVHAKLSLDDPHLLLWVHMAMVDAFLDVAVRSGLKLTVAEQDQYFLEMVKFAELVGVAPADVPNSLSQTQQYFADIKPELRASDDAKRAALFITVPPLPKIIRFATPFAPTWGAISTLAGAALPKWARDLYGAPTLPGQELATDVALKAFRSSLLLLPEAFRSPPQLKEARSR